jgi:AraC family transcriptional regulator of arabinose operon
MPLDTAEDPTSTVGTHASVAPSSSPSSSEALLENIYVLGHHGFVQTVPRPPSTWTRRPAAVLLVSPGPRTMDVELQDGRVVTGRVIAVASMVARRLVNRAPPLLSFNVQPLHRAFPQFRALNPPGAMALPPDPFRPFSEDFVSAYRGEVGVRDVEAVFKDLLTLVHEQLPPIGTPDPRLSAVLARLHEQPEATATELAALVGCSADWLSRRFSADMGISLRDYVGWLKQRSVFAALFTRRSITELALDAGFAGASQLSSAYQRWYGRTPSASRDPGKVRVFLPEATSRPRHAG